MSIGFLIVTVVFIDAEKGFPKQPDYFFGIIQAAVPPVPSDGIQQIGIIRRLDEGRVPQGAVLGHGYRVPLSRIPGFGSIRQGWRQFLERTDQLFVPVNLNFQGVDDVLIRHAGLVEIQILVGHFIQRVRQVESIVLLLGIEHQGELVAVLDQLDQRLVLQHLFFSHAFVAFLQLRICVPQFVMQDGEGLVQVLLLEHSASRQSENEDGG